MSVQTLRHKDIQINNKYLEDIFRNIHSEFSKEAYKFIKPISPALQLLKMLKNFNVKLFLITSDTKLNAEETIRYLNIKNYFDDVIGGDSCFGDKRSGNSCRYLCKNFNTSIKICSGLLVSSSYLTKKYLFTFLNSFQEL